MPINRLVERVLKCMTSLDRWLVLPADEFIGTALAEQIKRATGAQAVSFFMRDTKTPSQLRWAGGVGYKDPYPTTTYYESGPGVTAFVFRTRRALNMSVKDLEVAAAKRTIPYTGHCRNYIRSGQFNNLICVPIMFETKVLGVLKLESKGKNPRKPFPDEDQALAQIIASVVAVSFQQQIYNQLWREGELAIRTSRSSEECLQTLCEILAQRLHAQCASVFLKENANGVDILRYRAGVGYTEDYQKHRYTLTTPPSSFTSFVAKTQDSPVCLTVKQLQETDQFYYSGSCASNIEGGSFRNILAVPLVRGRDRERERYGVLKIENKLPDEAMFDRHDVDICRLFVERLITPALGRDASPGSGLAKLIEHLNQPKDLDRNDPLPQVWRVMEVRALSPKLVTVSDCVRYLDISPAHFYRLAKKAAKRFSKDS